MTAHYPDAPSVSPPTGDPMQAPQRPAWPSVIGVLSIVLSAHALFESGGGLRSMAIVAALRIIQGSAAANQPLVAGERLAAVYVACSTVLALLLAVAAVLTLRRRQIGRTLHIIWALLAVADALAYSWMCPHVLSDPFRGWYIARAISGSVLGLVYPIFLLVWFSTAKHRRQARWWRTTEGRALAKPVRPVWPTVLGVLAIVTGARASADVLTTSAIWLHYLLIGSEPLRTLAWPAGALLAPSLAGWVLLIGAGVLLLRRRQAGAICHVIFAAVRGMLVVAGPWLSLLWLPEQFRAQLDTLDIVRIVLPWLLWSLPYLVYPMFLLVWFHRPKIRMQVRQWRQAGELRPS